MNKQWLVRAFSKTLTLNLTSSTSYVRPFCSATNSTFAIKNVTKKNFDSALEDLKKHVRDADFVSVDLEMTGVTSAPWRESLDFDRFDVRYLKVKDSVEKFAVVQFGVCPFKWDSSKESFIAHPYNFYIFPRKELPFDGPAHEFLCQTTSIGFLAKYQFDFNACIHEGISYLSREQEAEALGRLNLAYEDELSNSAGHLKESRDSSSVRSADILFTWRMKNRFSEWRDSLLRNGGCQFEENSKDLTPQFQTVFYKMRPALKLNGFTSHQLRLIRLVTTKHFKELAFVRTNGENSSEQKLVVYTDSEDDRDMLMKEVRDDLHKEAELKVKAAAGFRHVIDLLSSEQKLVVGHNSFLDIAHIYSKFFGPLPSTVDEFVSCVHKNFRHIIDTKLLLNTDNVIQQLMRKKSTSLSSAFALLCPQIAFASESSALVRRPGVKVEVQVDDMRSSNWNSGAKHEAGYDAFMTGCVFAQACSHLGIDFKLHSLSSTGLAYHEKLQKYINLLYISWNNDAIIDLHTRNKTFGSSAHHNHKRRYPQILFPNIVLVWGFPSKFKPRDLKDCVTKVFGPDSVTSIYYLDETASFIQFSKKEFVSDFLELKETLDGKSDPISVLHPLSKLLEGGKTRAATYEVYKEICSSSISKKLFADQAEAVGIKCKNKVVELREGEPQGIENIEAPSSSSTEVEAGNLNSDSVNKNEIDKRSCDLKKDLSHRHLSGVELMDALYVTESQHEKRSKTSANA
ncbi:Ribonuclease CAF1 [Macleaya cordata]|uniref:Ribonuclease CAF1 n=1 Tax=Macleaya cordata TaxID=56857 RepID=A0A200PSB7_MACCD|nr:Ribonuclease CAF1 [Macleaya cordata]